MVPLGIPYLNGCIIFLSPWRRLKDPKSHTKYENVRARALQVFLPCFNTAEWSVLLGKPSFVLIRRPARAHFLHWSLPLYWHEALLYPLNEILILLSELHPALRHMWITVERAFWCDTRETISTRSCRNHIYDLQQISSESRENILLFHIENWYISS